MATWSGIRNKLETEYLAPSLRGRVRYFATTYRESHDQEGRAVILVDGEEVLKGSYYNYWVNYWQLKEVGAYDDYDGTALEYGLFDQRSFYHSFSKFDNQPIEESIASENLLIRIFALLDRRVGKRRLKAMEAQMQKEHPIIQYFYNLRVKAEGILTAEER